MVSLISVKRDAEVRLLFTKESGVAGEIGAFLVADDGAGSLFASFEIGPFDTNLDVVNWLLRWLQDARITKAC